MYQQIFRQVNKLIPSYFEKSELDAIIQYYGTRVKANEWRNYGILCVDRATTFVVLDENNKDIASFSKLKNGDFQVSIGAYALVTKDFDSALEKFRTDFGNKQRKKPALTVVT